MSCVMACPKLDLRSQFRHFTRLANRRYNSVSSTGWVDPWVGLGWVEYDKSTVFLMITQHTIARDRAS